MRSNCVPLCGASKAYGRFDKPWLHEPQCPVRMEWEVTRKSPFGGGLFTAVAEPKQDGTAEEP